MLSKFDWLRRSRTGTELLATLRYLAEEDYLPNDQTRLGPPFSALDGPCPRCWVYPRMSEAEPYCRYCHGIRRRGRTLSALSRGSLLVWGFVNQIPKQLQSAQTGQKRRSTSTSQTYSYIHDQNHFLLALPRRKIRPWIQELVIRHGPDIKGLMQFFPTTGFGTETGMGDLLCRIIHHEANYPMDLMRIRFYTAPNQVAKPHIRDRQGLLTFEISEFLGLLEMAEVFRAFLRPEEQKELSELLTTGDERGQQFYWGRLMGRLDQQAKDMITGWGIRQWPFNRIQLLYELIDYVALPKVS